MSAERRVAVNEIAPGIHRIATHHEPWRCSVNQYVVGGARPTLVATGLRQHFSTTWGALAEVLDPTTLHYIVIPHFAADECGALNDFLARLPNATVLGSARTVLTSLVDFASRTPRGVCDGEVIDTGDHALRVIEAPYVPAWDGIVLADERSRVVFTADLFGQPGMGEPLTREDRGALAAQLYGIFHGAPPETYLARLLDRLEAFAPEIIAPGHGSALGGPLTPYARAMRALASESLATRAVPEQTAALR